MEGLTAGGIGPALQTVGFLLHNVRRGMWRRDGRMRDGAEPALARIAASGSGVVAITEADWPAGLPQHVAGYRVCRPAVPGAAQVALLVAADLPVDVRALGGSERTLWALLAETEGPRTSGPGVLVSVTYAPHRGFTQSARRAFWEAWGREANRIRATHPHSGVLVAGDFNLWDPAVDPQGTGAGSTHGDDAALVDLVDGHLRSLGVTAAGHTGLATHEAGHCLDRIYASEGLWAGQVEPHGAACQCRTGECPAGLLPSDHVPLGISLVMECAGRSVDPRWRWARDIDWPGAIGAGRDQWGTIAAAQQAGERARLPPAAMLDFLATVAMASAWHRGWEARPPPRNRRRGTGRRRQPAPPPHRGPVELSDEAARLRGARQHLLALRGRIPAGHPARAVLGARIRGLKRWLTAHVRVQRAREWAAAGDAGGGRRVDRAFRSCAIRQGQAAPTEMGVGEANVRGQQLHEAWEAHFRQANISAHRQFDDAVHAGVEAWVQRARRREARGPPLRIPPEMWDAQVRRGAPDSAPGLDAVPYRMLQAPDAAWQEMWRGIAEGALQAGHFPSVWKVGAIIPLYKGSGDARAFQRYRPITLFPAVLKVVERCLMALTPGATTMAEPNQFAVRAGTTAARYLVHERLRAVRTSDGRVTLGTGWRTGEDGPPRPPGVPAQAQGHLWCGCGAPGAATQPSRYGGNARVALYVDFPAAFDKVWRAGCLWKLHCRGVRGPAWRAWDALFRGVRQTVVTAGRVGVGWPDDAEGTGQGRVVSPVVFMTMLDDLERHIAYHLPARDAHNVAVVKYMDDIHVHVDRPDLLPAVTAALSCWGNIWRVRFSLGDDKTALQLHGAAPDEQAAHDAARVGAPEWRGRAGHWDHAVFAGVTYAGTDPPPLVACALQGAGLPWVKHYRYLGAWVEDGLTGKRDDEQAERRVQALLAGEGGVAVLRDMPLGWLADGLRARLLPALLYGCEHGPHRRRRQALYHRVARLALGRARTSAVAGMLHDLGWQPFRVLAEAHVLRAAAALRAAPDGTPERELAAHSAGRPGTWMTAAEGLARAWGLSLPAWGATPGWARRWAASVLSAAAARRSEAWTAGELQRRATLRVLRNAWAPGRPRHLERTTETHPADLREWLRARAGTGAWLASPEHYHATGVDRCPFCDTGSAETLAHHLLDCVETACARDRWWQGRGSGVGHAGGTERVVQAIFDPDSGMFAHNVRFVAACARARRQALARLPEGLRQPWGLRRGQWW